MTLSVTSRSFSDGDRVPEAHAFGTPDPDSHATAGGGNRNPHLAWSGAPEGTKSFAVIVYDPDVPADASKAGVEGEVIGADEPRVDFAHLLLIDLPPNVTEIDEGAISTEIQLKGKPTGPSPIGGLLGVNTFTNFFEGDPDMGGTYGGYDGPFPPWNDERLHHYHFVVYALDVESLGLSGEFYLDDVRSAMEGHVLDQGEIVVTYTLNPDVG